MQTEGLKVASACKYTTTTQRTPLAMSGVWVTLTERDLQTRSRPLRNVHAHGVYKAGALLWMTEVIQPES